MTDNEKAKNIQQIIVSLGKLTLAVPFLVNAVNNKTLTPTDDIKKHLTEAQACRKPIF